MMKLQPTTINGNAINTSPFSAKFTTESGLDEFAGVETLMADNITGRPTYQGRTFTERRLIVRVKILTKTQANYETLMKYFDPALGEVDLVAAADDATSRTITVKVESRSVVEGADWIWEFVCVAADGRWRKAASQVVFTVGASGNTQALTNSGTTRTYPKIKVKAAVAKSAANGWTYRRFLHMANRAGGPLISPMGALGYPLLLTGAAIDFTGKAVAAFEDIRVFVDGKEWSRYLDGTIGAIKVWAPIPYNPQLSARLAVSQANNSTTITSQLMASSVANWPESGYVILDSEIEFYESHDDYYLYNLHRGMLNTATSTHVTLTPRYVMEHVVELWYNFSGVASAADAAYEIDDIATPGLDPSTSTNALHKWTSFWQRTKRYARQWVPELREVNAFDQFISLEDTATSMEFRDTPGRFKKNAMTIDCPVAIDSAAAAIEHDITIPTTLALKCIGQDIAGNDIELATYYKPDSGTAVALQPPTTLTNFRYEVHNQIVTGGVGTGTDTLVTTSAPYAQTFTLEEATTIRAIFYRHKRASGSDTIAIDLYKVNDDDAGSVDTRTKLMPTGAPASYNTSYVDETYELATAINVAAGTYALVWTCSGSTGVNIDSSDGSTYSGGEMRSGGVQTLSITTEYDVDVTSGGTKSTTDPLQVYGTAVGTPTRAAVRFGEPAAWPDNPTISSIKLRLNVETEAAGSTVNVNGLQNAGQTDPETEAGASLYTACATNNYASAVTVAVGTLDITLGSPAETDIIAAFAAGGFFALGISNNVTSGQFEFSAIADAANPEAKLLVEYAESTASAYTTVVGRDAYFLILGDAENAPQADAPAGQALEVIIDNVSFDYSSSYTPQVVNASEETTGVVMLYDAVLANTTTGQSVTIKLPCTVGDEFEIDCSAKTIKRTIIGSTKNNGIVGDHIPWCCEFSDDEEWFRLDPGSNTFSWTETGMAANGVVVTFDWNDEWS